MRNVLGAPEMCVKGYQTRKKALIAALAATYYCTMILQSHRDFKHSEASIRSSLMHQRWGLRGFLSAAKDSLTFCGHIKYREST